MSDAYNQYEDRLDQKLMQLGPEGLTLQRRLMENLARARMYGDTEISRTERVQLLDALNRLALKKVGTSFSALFSDEPGHFVWDVNGSITFVNREPVIIGDSDLAKQMIKAVHKAGDEAQDALHQAIETYEQNIATAHEIGDRQTEAIYLQELGLSQIRLADIEQEQRQEYLSRAADTLWQAIELFDTLDTPLLRARTRYHLGRCYRQLGRWREAITLLEQARETFSRHKARPELAHALLELGQLYHLIHDFESANIYLKDALRLFRRLKDTDGIAVTQEALGSLSLLTGRPSAAIDSFRKARRGYIDLQRDQRVREVDGLLQIAHRAIQPMGGAIS